MWNRLGQAGSRLSSLLHGIGIFVGIPTLILVLSLDVMLRYLFSAPLRWGAEVSSLLLLVVLVGSLSLCTEQQGHVRMDALYARFGPRLRRCADALASLCGLAFSALLTYQAVLSALEMVRWNQGAEMINLPYWPFSLFMALCGLLLTVRFVRELLAPPPADGGR